MTVNEVGDTHEVVRAVSVSKVKYGCASSYCYDGVCGIALQGEPGVRDMLIVYVIVTVNGSRRTFS